ncbi:hypothetical protein NADFUDRAFT_49517 [Nadsonia fulvescens var. elongata DSM 6958]|uniref:Uncharacterized protein n=1 Tax=Nadsonia fulvescens var. elongata DSM 6958 TaxID=857566 RepID=A0A1E3PQ81_9ASCO|nr:hypothetical protein NADFUDRAFT_49517 [Nadsonia fulvescens var. elongata DSM 6958]
MSLALGSSGVPTGLANDNAIKSNGLINLCNNTESGSSDSTNTAFQRESIFKTLSRFLPLKPQKREWVSGSAGSEACMACNIMPDPIDDEPLVHTHCCDNVETAQILCATSLEDRDNDDYLSDVADNGGDVSVMADSEEDVSVMATTLTMPNPLVRKARKPVNPDESVYDKESFALKLKLQHMRNNPELYETESTPSVSPVATKSQKIVKASTTLTPPRDQLKFEDRKHSNRGPEGSDNYTQATTTFLTSSQATSPSEFYSNYLLCLGLLVSTMAYLFQ